MPRIILGFCCKSGLILKAQERTLNKSIKIFLNWFLGPLLFLWLSWSIYGQVIRQPDLDQHLRSMRDALSSGSIWMFIMVVLLMGVNWGLEARKWQVLLRHLEPLPFRRAFQAILSGLAFAMNTPNRIGEYGGRILFIPEGKRWKAVSLTVAGSMSQLLVTLAMGSIGLTVLRGTIVGGVGAGQAGMWVDVFRFITAICTMAGLLVYFRLGWLIRGIDRIPGMAKLARHISVMEELTVSVLLRVLLLSLLRFLVFGIQYILMLRFLQVGVGWWPGFWSVSVLFLLLAMVPTIALLELGMRWEYSLVLFRMYSTNVVGIYAAATGIWLINLVLPALAGSLLILGVRIFRERE